MQSCFFAIFFCHLESMINGKQPFRQVLNPVFKAVFNEFLCPTTLKGALMYSGTDVLIKIGSFAG